MGILNSIIGKKLSDHNGGVNRETFKQCIVKAENGDSVAQYNLAHMYMNGIGTKANKHEALCWFKIAAEQGYQDAQLSLAYMYYAGYGIQIDYREALRWYEAAAKQGNIDAQNSVAYMYLNGYGADVDIEKALYWYNESAKLGNVDAQNYLKDTFQINKANARHGDVDSQYILFLMYSRGYGTEIDVNEALYWGNLAVECNHKEALNNLVDLYANDEMLGTDLMEKFKLFKNAATQGNVTAQFKLAKMYEKGDGIEADLIEAVNWYSKAAEQGHIEAQFEVAMMYYNMYKLKQCDSELAEKWLKKAAEQGHLMAQHKLGRLYLEMSDIADDVYEYEYYRIDAFNYLKMSAEQGYVKDQYELAKLYLTRITWGPVEDDDKEKAMYWFNKSAEQGDVDAQFELAGIYNSWKVGEPNLAEALKWYKMAADQGHKKAIEMLDRLRQK